MIHSRWRVRGGALLGLLVLGGCAADRGAPPDSQALAPAPAPASAVFDAPFAPHPRRVPVRRAEWDFATTPGVVIETPHFRVHSTALGSAVVDRLPLFSEDALRAYRTRFVDLPEPDGLMDTFLMQNRAEWELLTRHLMGERAEDYLQVRQGGFAAGGRTVLRDLGMQRTLGLAAHEGWHQYTQRAFRDRLPPWLEEGMATQFEGFRWSASNPGRAEFLPWANLERFDVLREAHADGRLMPLIELLSTTPAEQLARSDRDAVRYYAQLWALVRFLEEGAGGRHRASLARALEDAASGGLEALIRRRLALSRADARRPEVRGVGVFTAYFDGGMSELGAAYERFVRELVRPGARDLVAEGESPL